MDDCAAACLRKGTPPLGPVAVATAVHQVLNFSETAGLRTLRELSEGWCSFLSPTGRALSCQPWCAEAWDFARDGHPHVRAKATAPGAATRASAGGGAIVSVHLGGRGVALAEAAWPLFHASQSVAAGAALETMWYRADTRPGERLVPRAVLVDCGEMVAARVLSGPQRNLFHPVASLASRTPWASSSEALRAGAARVAADPDDTTGCHVMLELTLERCRAFVEDADSLQGFMSLYAADDCMASRVAGSLACTDAFQEAFGKCHVCSVVCTESPKAIRGSTPPRASVVAALNLRQSEANAGVIFSGPQLAAAARTLESEGLPCGQAAVALPEDAVVGSWLDLFTHSWRTLASRRYGHDLEDCGTVWHPALKFLTPSLQAHSSAPLTELVRALHQPPGLLLDLGAVAGGLNGRCYLSDKVFARCGGESASAELCSACRELRPSLAFAGFVDGRVASELQARSQAAASPTTTVVGVSNHTGFGAWLEAQAHRAASSALRLSPIEQDACQALIQDYETAVHELNLSSALGAPWC